MTIGHPIRRAALAALFSSMIYLAQITSGTAADPNRIAASADAINPVKTGEMAPSFTVRTVEDEPFFFDPANLDAPVVLVTFRGGWCPYCNMHLSELRKVLPEVRELGFDVYFLSGDRPELLYKSLKRETQEDIDGLGYTILSDAGIEAATALGIAFRVSEDTIAGRQKNDQDIAGSSMLNHGVLPVPAVYIIDSNGKVAYSFVEPDYKVRLSAEDLLDVVRELRD